MSDLGGIEGNLPVIERGLDALGSDQVLEAAYQGAISRYGEPIRPPLFYLASTGRKEARTITCKLLVEDRRPFVIQMGIAKLGSRFTDILTYANTTCSIWWVNGIYVAHIPVSSKRAFLMPAMILKYMEESGSDVLVESFIEEVMSDLSVPWQRLSRLGTSSKVKQITVITGSDWARKGTGFNPRSVFSDIARAYPQAQTVLLAPAESIFWVGRTSDGSIGMFSWDYQNNILPKVLYPRKGVRYKK